MSYESKDKQRVFNEEFMPQYRCDDYNFAFRLTLDEDDAKDLVQETFMKAYRFINSFETGTNAKALAVSNLEE